MEEGGKVLLPTLHGHSQLHSNVPLLPRSTRKRRPLLEKAEASAKDAEAKEAKEAEEAEEAEEAVADKLPTPTVCANNCSQLYFFKISSCTWTISNYENTRG